MLHALSFRSSARRATLEPVSSAGKKKTQGSFQSQKKKERNSQQSKQHNNVGLVRKYLRTFQAANPRKRAAMAAVTAVAALVVVALIVVLVNFVSYRVQVEQAKYKQTQLTSLYDFDPGNIISDDQFFNGSAMNEAQIQSFLDEQGESCTGDHCLRTKTFDVSNKAATDYCNEYVADSSGKEKASTIIYKTAQACSVSPKVLLTMLQKEQHLVTDTDPSDFQFEAAMGLSCPDTASCDPKYAGFFNQVYGSAERYQYYVAHEEQYGYTENSLNFIQYNPDASCGGSNVYIETKATALLYIYTPYQPNLAALEAGAGEGNSCSTYGNRNFSLIYQGWFGDPRT